MKDDKYGSVFRRKRMDIMAEPAQSTAEKFRTLNRRQRDTRLLDRSSKWVLALIWICLIAVVISQLSRYHHG